MGIESEMQAALANIASEHSDLSVTVAYRAQTATGVRVLTDKRSDLDDRMLRGSEYGTVRVSAAKIAEPDRGAHIKVGGVQVYVEDCRTSGGLRVIEYSTTNPVEGV
jgi:hypothetical protein